MITLTPRIRTYREKAKRTGIRDHSKEKEEMRASEIKRLEQERKLLKRMDAGELDGMVGDMFQTDGGSTVWTIIKNGIPVRFKQGPGGKFFNGKENERYEGVLHTLAKWMTDEERLDFLRKFGWLIHDAAVNAYSAKFKPKK